MTDDRLVAYCGLDCAECPAYVATQAGDIAALEKVVAQARGHTGRADLTIEGTYCDGCPGTDGRKGDCVGECGIRACALAKGVATCAECDRYACDLLEPMLAQNPKARDVLDQLRL